MSPIASRKTTQEDKSFLNMAGEFAVASELNRRHVLASVTYGSSKSADVFALSPDMRRVVRIEVKTTEKGKWPIGKRGTHPEAAPDVVWVFVQLPSPLTKKPADDAERGGHAPRFFILTAAHLHAVWKKEVEPYYARYRAKHGHDFDEEAGGVPNVRLESVRTYEGRWDTITKRLGAGRRPEP